jgi:kumamolisin
LLESGDACRRPRSPGEYASRSDSGRKEGLIAAEPRLPLAGSERTLPPGARPIGPVGVHDRLTVTVLVRRREAAPPEPGDRLTRAAFARVRGADEADLNRVERFSRAHGLTVVESSSERRSVLVSGTAGALCAAFGVELARYSHVDGDFRGRTGPVYLPAELADVVEGVFGLDDRPQAQAQFRIADAAAVSASYTPPELAALYRFPQGGTGAGECVAIIELGGGYRSSDLDAYFAALGLATPEVVAVGVDGGSNAPTGDANGPDAEVMLDIEVAGSIAPAARIAVYFAPNTDQGFVDAVSTAVHDRQNAPSVISISWGGPESSWTTQAIGALDQSFADAASLGVTVCVACGDNGSGDGVGDGQAHVDFPASSPHALACGGTRLQASGGSITAETVWNEAAGGATGGGVSQVFDLPDWQQAAGVPTSANGNGRVGRGVPDVAGDADPTTGYRVRVDGRDVTVGGTSAVAPLWAALVALLNQQRGTSAGRLNPELYAAPVDRAFRDITVGSNAEQGTPGYSAGPGWDACTGLGSPDGQALLAALTQS